MIIKFLMRKVLMINRVCFQNIIRRFMTDTSCAPQVEICFHPMEIRASVLICPYTLSWQRGRCFCLLWQSEQVELLTISELRRELGRVSNLN